MKRAIGTFGWCLLLGAVAFGQTPQQTQEAAQAIARSVVNWQNASTRGLSVEAKELWRKPTPQGTMVSYALYVHGFAQDAHLNMVIWPIRARQPQPSLSGITLDAAGRTLCDGKPGDCGDPAKPGDTMDMDVLAAPGEPLRYGLSTPDGKQRVTGTVVPFPLIGRDGACSVELLRLLPNAELVAAEAHGFAPNEKLRITSTSHGEARNGIATADAHGNWTSLFEPAQLGKTGTLAVTVAGQSCKPQTSIQWGAASYGR